MKRFRLLIIAGVQLLAGITWAQTDVTSSWLVNADFEGEYTSTDHPDASQIGVRYLHQPAGWDITKIVHKWSYTCMEPTDPDGGKYFNDANSIAAYKLSAGNKKYMVRFYGKSGSNPASINDVINLYQTVTVPESGTYIFSAQMIAHNSNFRITLYAGDDENSRVSNSTTYDSWEVRSFSATLEAGATINVGIKFDHVTATAEAYGGVDNITVTKFNGVPGAVEWSAALATATAALNNSNYANVRGSELAALQAAVNAEEVAETEWYNAQTTLLNEATEAFIAAAAGYNRLAAAIAKADAIEVEHADATALWNSDEATAATAIIAANELYKNMFFAVYPETYTVGFEAGEWAPYNLTFYVEGTTELDEEKIAASTPAALAAAIDRAKENTEEVSAVYDGSFVEGTAGWTAEKWSYREKNGNNVYFGSAGTLTYGTVAGYTMPLKANTVYQLKFRHAGWDGGNPDTGGTVSVLNENEEGMQLSEFSGTSANKGSDASKFRLETFKFKTGAAGNYILKLNANKRCAYTAITLTKAVIEDLIIKEDSDFTLKPTLANVTLHRTFENSTWNTFVVPFDIDNELLTATFGNKVAVAAFTETVTGENSSDIAFNKMEVPEIKANQPVLLKTTTTDTIFIFENRFIEKADPVIAGQNYEFAGSYLTTTKMAEGDYYLLADDVVRVTGEEETTLTTTHAYLKAKSSESVMTDFFIEKDKPTGIETIAKNKVQGANEIFDLQGRRISTIQKGIYIVSPADGTSKGKKIVR